jgi:L-aspartate oxidase
MVESASPLAGKANRTYKKRGQTPLLPSDIQRLMWASAGPFRAGQSLVEVCTVLGAQQEALDERLAAGPLLDRDEWRQASLVTVASLIARAALRREESRGGHFRTDFPCRDDEHWKVHVSDTARPESRHYT